MRDFMQRRPFTAFYVIAIAFPTLLFSYLVVLEILFPDLYGNGIGTVAHFYATKAAIEATHPLLGQHNDSVLLQVAAYIAVPFGAPFLFFPFAPTVSALVVTAVARGSTAVRALLGAYRPVRGSLGAADGLRLYALLLACLTAILALVLLNDSLFNGGDRLAHFEKYLGFDDVTLFAAGWGAALFFNQGGLLEELGWRGYAWPVLVRHLRDPLRCALLLGVAWALWHFPREIPPLLQGQQGLGALVLNQALFITMCCGMTLVAVYFVNASGGSVLPAIMVHGFFNFLGGALSSGRTGVRSDFSPEPAIIWAIAGLVTLLLAGRDLGWGRRCELHGGDGSLDPARVWAG